MELTIFNKIVNLLETDTIYKINEYNINNIFEVYSILDIKKNIDSLINITIDKNKYKYLEKNKYKYKYEYYIPLYNFIINLILKYNKVDKTQILFNSYDKLINNLTLINKGYFYLYKIKKYIIKSNDDNTKLNDDNIIILAAKYGSFPTFIFWIKFLNITNSSVYLINAITNVDDRIYKYILNNNTILTLHIFQILLNLLKSNIPIEYKLKRIKNLSSFVNLQIFYEYMIENTTNFNMFYYLTKYYYNYEINFLTFFKFFQNDPFNNPLSMYENLYNLLNTTKEKNCFAILFNIYCHYNKISNIKIIGSINNIIDENYITILKYIYIQQINNNSVILNNIFKYMTDNRYINKYLDIDYDFLYHKYSRFYIPTYYYDLYSIEIIKINKILHHLRLYVKKYIKNKFRNFKLYFNPIIQEINNYKPTNILKNGSVSYQLQKQKFNTIPPRHLLPQELLIYNECLIKQKADGILTNILPKNIYPECNFIHEYELKAEYIEEYELYLVFDINIPNSTILERYNMLRQAHSYTQNCLNDNIINNFDELLININNENINVNKFLNENTNKIKWYPKASWKTYINNDLYININYYIEESIYIDNKSYDCDGLILTPLDGAREIKIKPKSLLTIDLLFDNNNWKDKNNRIWNNIILNNTKCYKLNKIYRCYPIIMSNKDLLFKPIEVRYDKKQPNDSNIIEQVIQIYKTNWSNNIISIPYYKYFKNIKNKQICNMINSNDDFLMNLIKKIKPVVNKNWLDLGCGKCKFFININKLYNPKKYLGMDIDITRIAKAIKYYDEKPNILQLYPVDLSLSWTDFNIKWSVFNWSIKYDYIIANFSIMYFCNDIFFTQLNKIIEKGGILIFNIVKENTNVSFLNSYLVTNNNHTKIKFEWVHENEQYEPFISFMELSKYLINYGWIIINKFNNNYSNFTKCYDWYIIEKI